jgi:hypothetical protein
MPGLNSGFFIVPFSLDGEAAGQSFWKSGDLSKKWLSTCNSFLNAHGAVFEDAWNGSLSHIRTRLTSTSGAALLTFVVREKVAASVLLLSGIAPAIDNDVAKMFVESMRRCAPAMAAAPSNASFNQVLSIQSRPLMVVVPWPELTVSDHDHEIVRELGLHLAAAFFAKSSGLEIS